ncbi:amidohydrolase family protein [Thermodesulfobacteriota bacterium]
MEYDLIIANATVVTVNAEDEVLQRAMVCVRGGEIADISGQQAETAIPAAKKVIDASGCIALPGLVNTHTHLPMTLFRGMADDLPLMTWLNEHIFPAEGRFLNPESVRAGALLGCAEMLLSGTTTCCDGYFYEDEVAEAVWESGIRAVVGHGVIDFPAPGVPDPAQNVTVVAAFVDRWQDRSSLVHPSIFCHSPYTCSPATLKQAKHKAAEAGCLFQIHVAETSAEVEDVSRRYGARPVEHLDRVGVLDRNTLCVHAIWVDERDIGILARTGAKVAVTTESEMKLASGIAPITGFLEAGVTVGLGTDGSASNNNADMFGEMDMTAKLHKVHSLDPTVMDARTVLRLATVEAAKAIGLGDAVGSIEKGKRADLIVIDTHAPHLTPVYNPVSHLVYAAGGSDVRDVIVDGRVVVEGGTLLTMELEKILTRMAALGKNIASG